MGYRKAALSLNPISYLPLDDTSTTIVDLVRTGSPGTLTVYDSAGAGGPYYSLEADGPFPNSKGIRFLGNHRVYRNSSHGALVVLADLMTVGTAHNMTITAWIKPSGSPLISFGNVSCIVDHSKNNSEFCAIYYDDYVNDISSYQMRGALGTGPRYFSSYPLGSFIGDTWYYVAGTTKTVGSTTTLRSYINGVEVGSASFTPTQSSSTSSVKYFIGGSDRGANSGSYAQLFDGVISETATFDYALSQSQLIDLYRRGVHPTKQLIGLNFLF